MNAIKALSNELHGSLKIDQDPTYSQVKTEHLLPVVVHEFSQLAVEYAIVFVKHAESGVFQPVVLSGLTPGSNLYYSESGWQADRIPKVIANYPFVLIQNPDDDSQLMVGVNEQSSVLNAFTGDALFNADGSESAFLLQRKQQLSDFVEQSQITKVFVNTIAEMGLLTSQKLALTINGNKQELTGLYLIDEQKLNALDEAQFMQLRSRGFIAPLYAHLVSLHNLARLAKKASKVAG